MAFEVRNSKSTFSFIVHQDPGSGLGSNFLFVCHATLAQRQSRSFVNFRSRFQNSQVAPYTFKLTRRTRAPTPMHPRPKDVYDCELSFPLQILQRHFGLWSISNTFKLRRDTINNEQLSPR